MAVDDHTGTFEPVADDEPFAFRRGLQGADMIGIRIGVRGADAPACIAQRTEVTDASGGRVGTDDTPLSTNEGPEGWRVTGPLWIVLPSARPERVTIDVQVYGERVTRTVPLTNEPPPGADAG